MNITWKKFNDDSLIFKKKKISSNNYTINLIYLYMISIYLTLNI